MASHVVRYSLPLVAGVLWLAVAAMVSRSTGGLTRRRHLRDILTEPRTASSVAHELGLRRGDIEEELRHAIRSARAAGDRIAIEPARCRTCGFLFDGERVSKPGRCPECRGTRIFEPLISIEPSEPEQR